MPQTRQMPSPAASSSQVLQVPDEQSAIRISGTLRLRGEDNSNSSGINTGSAPNRHIRWSQDVVDNEGMGKKSSKGDDSFFIVCFLFITSETAISIMTDN